MRRVLRGWGQRLGILRSDGAFEMLCSAPVEAGSFTYNESSVSGIAGEGSWTFSASSPDDLWWLSIVLQRWGEAVPAPPPQNDSAADKPAIGEE